MKKNEIRLIAGRFRGRKIVFPSFEALRPTPDRVRETLFNWLAPHIVKAVCLDLFAGSGALGFEAISRGADSVVLVEKNPLCLKALEENAKTLNITSQVELVHDDALTWVSGDSRLSRDSLLSLESRDFDIIFLDPPYQSNLLEEALKLIVQRGLLKPSGFIYCESDKPIDSLDFFNPAGFSAPLQIYRHKKAGQVYFSLVKISAELNS